MKWIRFILIFSPLYAYNQTNSFRCIKDDFIFGQYLVNSGMYRDALVLFRSDPPDSCVYSDSILFLKGWSFYNLKQLDSASVTFSKIGIRSPLFLKSSFYSAYCNTYLGKISKAREVLNTLTSPDSVHNELKLTELAGINLLQRDLIGYSDISKSFSGKRYTLVENQKKLNEIYQEMKSFNPKSPWVAGLLSAGVPGLGKIYAGKYGSGVSAMITVSILGLVTWENYRKAGIDNPKTIVAGSLFSIAYLANIYGSVYSIKSYRDEFYERMDYRILFHLHIPIRNTFN